MKSLRFVVTGLVVSGISLACVAGCGDDGADDNMGGAGADTGSGGIDGAGGSTGGMDGGGGTGGSTGGMGGAMGGMGGMDSMEDSAECVEYCDVWFGADANCNNFVDEAQKYADGDECLSVCAGFPSGAMSGDTVECRVVHVNNATVGEDGTAQMNSSTTHCPHAQKDPSAVCK